MAIRNQLRRSFKAAGVRGPSALKVKKQVKWSTPNTSSLGAATRVTSSPYQTAQVAPVGAPVRDTADYQDAIASTEHDYNTGIGSLRQAEDRARYDFGLDGDTRNPFSRAATLKKTYGENQARDTNGYAARGQLYSGALSNAQSNTTAGYLQDDNSMQTSYRRAMEDYATQERTLGTQRQLSIDSAVRRRDAAAAEAQAKAAADAQAQAGAEPQAAPEAAPQGGGKNAFSNAMAQQNVKYRFVKRKDGSLWKVFANGTQVQTRGKSK